MSVPRNYNLADHLARAFASRDYLAAVTKSTHSALFKIEVEKNIKKLVADAAAAELAAFEAKINKTAMRNAAEAVAAST